MNAFTLCFDFRKKSVSFHSARIIRGTNASASCKNVAKIGSVTLELSKEVCGLFATTGQQTGKMAYSTEYLSNYWIELYHAFNVDSRVYENYKAGISFAVVQ